MQDEKTIVIDINLTRGLVTLLALLLLVAVLLGYLAWNQGAVAASGPQAPAASSAGMRGYYLTTDHYDGSEALTACASGYHMASLWEILAPSKLKYNTDLGMVGDDSGQGPPSIPSAAGWVRTGYYDNTSDTPGTGNCNAWTSSSSGDDGTYARLPTDWTAGQDIHVWAVNTVGCGGYLHVWCVED
jgi:hypothetical protein